VLPLHLEPPAGRPLSLLAVGAHPDDIEIGAGGLLLQLAARPLQARYVLLTGTEERQAEARDAAAAKQREIEERARLAKEAPKAAPAEAPAPAAAPTDTEVAAAAAEIPPADETAEG